MELAKELLIFWAPGLILISIVGKWAINRMINPKLYRIDGQTHFVPRDQCRDERNQCTSAVCRKVDSVDKTTQEIKKAIAVMEEKRDRARSQIVGEMQDLTKTVHSLQGRFDQYVSDVNSNKTSSLGGGR